MSGRSKRILVLYWHHESLDLMRVGIRQHVGVLESSEHKHQLLYYNTFQSGPPPWLRHLEFDAVLFHNTFLCMRWAHFFYYWKHHHAWVADLTCPKIAMPQDEYDHAYVLDEWLYELGVDVIISNFCDPTVHRMLYPLMHKRAKFEFGLTGYLDDTLVELYRDRVRPTKDRPLDVVYRANHLPYWFGSHGQMKWQVGHAVDRRARERGMKSNISTDSADVIVGYKWLDFLASSKAITGCEGGSSVIDRRGERMAQIKDMLRRDPGMSFEEVSRFMPPDWDGTRLPLIGPRHLEAAMTRTCQILVEGTFCDVLESGRHYIPIKRDYSNLDEVLDRLQDHASVQRMVDCSFEELCTSGRFSRRVLARTIEESIDACAKDPSGVSVVIRAVSWPFRTLARPKACESVDLRISDEELAALGEVYTPEPRSKPDKLERANGKTAEKEALTRIDPPYMHVNGGMRVKGDCPAGADALVLLNFGEQPVSRWRDWSDYFARAIPVWVVDAAVAGRSVQSSVEYEGDVNWLHACAPDPGALHRRINEELCINGVRRPLLVTDEIEAAEYVRGRYSALTVVVATDDWLTLKPDAADTHQARELLARTDLLLTESGDLDELAVNLLRYTGELQRFHGLEGLGDLMVSSRETRLQAEAERATSVVFVRGNIDDNVDYELLEQVCDVPGAASFWFSGPVIGQPQGWTRLLKRGNVRHIEDRPGEWKWYAWRGHAGLQPYRKRLARSLRDGVAMLACGLPLVTTFQPWPDIAAGAVHAQGADAVLRAIEAQGRLRYDERAMDQRKVIVRSFHAAASLKQVSERMTLLGDRFRTPEVAHEGTPVGARHDANTTLNVLLLHAGDAAALDDIVGAASWPMRSRYVVYRSSAYRTVAIDLEPFDAVIVHGSASSAFPSHLSLAWQQALVSFGGVKLLHLQEGDVNEAAPALRELGFHALIARPQTVSATAVEGLDLVGFFGGVLSDVEESRPPLPLNDRSTVLSYRPEFAPLSVEPPQDTRALIDALEHGCGMRGMAVDLRPRKEPEDWRTFLSASRAIVIAQTRKTLFDHRGNLRDTVRGFLNREPELTYDEAAERFTRDVTYNVRHHVLPRVLEAVERGTALVMLEGNLFDHLLVAGRHYVELRRDLSNLDAVLECLADTSFLQAMARRAYEEVIVGTVSQAGLIAICDDYLARACRRGNGNSHV